jgi:hypothetical protein
MMGAPPPPKTRKHRTMGKPSAGRGIEEGAVKGKIASRYIFD